MSFHIGNQNANQINNVGGDQHISGGQHGTVVTIAEAQAAAQALRLALQNVRVPPEVGDWLRRDAAAVGRDLATGTPDRDQVAGRLERLTKALGQWGALAQAGAGLAGPLATLGHWLGPAGATLLGLLA